MKNETRSVIVFTPFSGELNIKTRVIPASEIIKRIKDSNSVYVVKKNSDGKLPICEWVNVIRKRLKKQKFKPVCLERLKITNIFVHIKGVTLIAA